MIRKKLTKEFGINKKIGLGKKSLIFLAIISLVVLIFLGVTIMALEKPEYSIIEKDGKFEVRQYNAYIVAETFIAGDFKKASNAGFRRLAGYIFGKNRKKSKIAMTAPVTMEDISEKIAMTSPVTMAKKDSKWRVTFMMPAKYTMDTLPAPMDPKVTLRMEPEVLIASLRYSGTWSEKRYTLKKERLMELIALKGYESMGDALLARYDPPFMPAFMRRNEVQVPVRKRGNQASQ